MDLLMPPAGPRVSEPLDSWAETEEVVAGAAVAGEGHEVDDRLLAVVASDLAGVGGCKEGAREG
jgi:hypothetical protein